MKLTKEYCYKLKHGVLINDYEKLLKQQNNKCVICNMPNPGNSRSVFVSIMTARKRKILVRGLLCDDCSRVLGIFEDNPERLVVAAGYLLRVH
ncbi:hypothetical protein LCGC14_2190340 [marine sediment metagenome]|uniref:Recombination endonuclease VII n=1 Tax=marine sediment metagenome TaxID=412755 RepID=A0A0F9E6T0_9ZZZZ